MLTQQLLKSYLKYEPLTGDFIRVVDAGRRFKKGSIAGSIDNEGYVIITIERKRYKAHRLAVLYMTGLMPPNEVDHEDGITGRNVWSNLRVSTTSENQQNKKKKKNATSKFFGVYFNKGYRGKKKYHAYINEAGSQKLIGRYLTELEAHSAYCEAKKSLHQFQPVLREDCKTNC